MTNDRNKASTKITSLSSVSRSSKLIEPEEGWGNPRSTAGGPKRRDTLDWPLKWGGESTLLGLGGLVLNLWDLKLSSGVDSIRTDCLIVWGKDTHRTWCQTLRNLYKTLRRKDKGESLLPGLGHHFLETTPKARWH